MKHLLEVLQEGDQVKLTTLQSNFNSRRTRPRLCADPQGARAA